MTVTSVSEHAELVTFGPDPKLEGGLVISRPASARGVRQADIVLDPDRRVDTRTSASWEPSCRWCRGAIRGRRRNGFCSDRCRMRARRAERAARVEALLADIDHAVTTLRRELGSERDGHTRDMPKGVSR